MNFICCYSLEYRLYKQILHVNIANRIYFKREFEINIILYLIKHIIYFIKKYLNNKYSNHTISINHTICMFIFLGITLFCDAKSSYQYWSF